MNMRKDTFILSVYISVPLLVRHSVGVLLFL